MLSHFFLLFSLNLTSMVPVLRYSVLYGIRYSVFGTAWYSVLGILVMANADGMRGVSGRNCSAVCCVVRKIRVSFNVGPLNSNMVSIIKKYKFLYLEHIQQTKMNKTLLKG